MSTETFLTPDAGLISCDVFVREKVRGPEDVVCGFWDVVISTPAYVQGARGFRHVAERHCGLRGRK